MPNRYCISRNLNELIEAGFVAANDNINPTTGRKSKIKTYRICDNYTRFYLKYIEPYEDDIRAGHFPFSSLSELPGWRTGLQIDLLVQTERTAMLVEVKNRYRIDSDIESEIKEKRRRFPKRRTTSLRTALVYDGELAPHVVQSGIFDITIPFPKLLRLN